MNTVTDQIARRSQDLSSEKQSEVLDFIEFLASRQKPSPGQWRSAFASCTSLVSNPSVNQP